MTRRGVTGFAALGAGLVALGYGLARFAYGLFVPFIRETLGLSPEAIGFIGALTFVSFVATSLFAPFLAERLGARTTAVLASAAALVGLAAIAGARGAGVLALGVGACGVCTGLIMPTMTEAVRASAPSGLHGRLNAVNNAGTSIGVAAAAPAVLAWATDWRSAYTAFAAVALMAAVLAWRHLPGPRPGGNGEAPGTRPALGRDQRHAMATLSVFAFVMGLVSAPYWVFTPDLVTALAGASPRQTALIWLAVGLAGLAGGGTGDIVHRLGAPLTHGAALGLLALALVLIAAAPGNGAVALLSAALFGVAYMTLTGLHVVCGVRILHDRPAAGAVPPFTAIAVGQVCGSSLAGVLIPGFGYAAVFTGFAAAGALVCTASALVPERAGGTAPTFATDHTG
ncbi:hypothetical protein KBTX_04031 [wastewater metagenome]|uniref:Major facilitator superfamily (MFS) profile domain-containing protein n=2 Tax=unclassified sequences TaxID=12908 RepID=A0A5B8RGA9_9ZZZZ|nr:MFS transporter [Arhodomonas sp. KWT]QEA07671.1 hypothetical protein KBTEX_04031 [uncultured organism]